MEMYEGTDDFAQKLTRYVTSGAMKEVMEKVTKKVTKEFQFAIAKSMIEEGLGSSEKIAQRLKLLLSDVEALQKECEAEAAEAEKQKMQTKG